MKKGRLFFGVLFLGLIAQMAFYYSALPGTLASHFDGAGAPNGYMPKSGFFMLDMALVCLLLLGFGVLPSFVFKASKAFISLPNKDYWLAPERIKETEASLSSMMLWVANASLLLILFMNQIVIRFNLSQASRLENQGAIAAVVVTIVAFILIGFVRGILRFYKKSELEKNGVK